MLDEVQTQEYIKLAKKGDSLAKSVLIEENSPLVKSVIKRFKNSAIEYEDLFQIGCVGFLKAIKNFDEKFNVKFSTYVVPMIIGEVKRFLRDDGIIKVSRNIKSQNIQINKFIKQFEEANNKKPSFAEISKYFGIDEEEIVFIMDSAKQPISIFTPLEDEDSGLTIIDRFSETNEVDDFFDKIEIRNLLSKLNDKEKKLVILRFFRDKTQTEIANIMKISQVQVSRLENKILADLKNKLVT